MVDIADDGRAGEDAMGHLRQGIVGGGAIGRAGREIIDTHVAAAENFARRSRMDVDDMREKMLEAQATAREERDRRRRADTERDDAKAALSDVISLKDRQYEEARDSHYEDVARRNAGYDQLERKHDQLERKHDKLVREVGGLRTAVDYARRLIDRAYGVLQDEILASLQAPDADERVRAAQLETASTTIAEDMAELRKWLRMQGNL